MLDFFNIPKPLRSIILKEAVSTVRNDIDYRNIALTCKFFNTEVKDYTSKARLRVSLDAEGTLTIELKPRRPADRKADSKIFQHAVSRELARVLLSSFNIKESGPGQSVFLKFKMPNKNLDPLSNWDKYDTLCATFLDACAKYVTQLAKLDYITKINELEIKAAIADQKNNQTINPIKHTF